METTVRTLIKNGTIVNVFSNSLERENVLIEDDKIIGVGPYDDTDAEVIYDAFGKYICPGFIDGHSHIESTMLTPYEFSKAALPHGTTSVVADPHEIANVCGLDGIDYMLASSENLPLNVYVNIPSCVPATPFDESKMAIEAEEIEHYYANPRVLGLAEMMNYPGVLGGDPKVLKKIQDAHAHRKVVDAHGPLLSGRELDKYIAAGILNEHECTNSDEAIEKLKKGQRIMIRQGTAARDLIPLLPLFDEPYCNRCLLVTDDKHPADIINEGHIDYIIRTAVEHGKSVITAIKMATIQAAESFNLMYVGAVAPGYRADILVLDDLEKVSISEVYAKGRKVVSQGELIEFEKPKVSQKLEQAVRNSFYNKELTEADFYIEPKAKKCRVIKTNPGQLLTDEYVAEIDWDKNNGISVEKDILKLAVIERHGNTGHIGVGFIKGIGITKGAIAASVSHDSHNLIVIGTNDNDMACVANCVRNMGGGNGVAVDGEIVAKMPLPIAGLMTEVSAKEAADANEKVRGAVHQLGAPLNMEPFMMMAFVSLPVIPHLKMTPGGLVDVGMRTFFWTFIQPIPGSFYNLSDSFLTKFLFVFLHTNVYNHLIYL